METQIKASLTSLLDAIRDGRGAAISEEMERLDALLAKGGKELSPQLAHFLQNRSYAKALQYLGGAVDLPTGACGGRPALG